METVLFGLFIAYLAFFTLQFIYYGFIFSRFSFAQPQEGTPKSIAVSVIICAQNYPNYELVLINDASSDDSLELLEEYERMYPFIKLVKVENNEAFWGNKKFALTLGIKAAKNEYLLFTDADCRPNDANWIAEMTAHFTAKKTIVLGYGAYEKIKGSF